MFSWLPYFAQEFFSFSCIWLLVWVHVISPKLLVEFSFVVLSVLHYPLSISLKSSFFRQYFLIYFLKLYCYFFSCCFFLFVSICFNVFPLFYRFCLFVFLFFCVSRQISLEGFDFLFVHLKGTQIFSQTNFAPA